VVHEAQEVTRDCRDLVLYCEKEQIVDSDLRELERAAASGDSQARLRFFAAAKRSDDLELALVLKIEERVYSAAMFALAAAERGVDPGSSRFYDGRVIESTLAVTEDDCVRALARCARELVGLASWRLLLLKKCGYQGVPVVAGVLAARSTDGEVALAIRSCGPLGLGLRSSNRFPFELDEDDLGALSATIEALRVFSIPVLPTDDDFRAARRAMRRAGGGPLVRPRTTPPAESIATWAEYAPERRGRSAWIDEPDTMSPTYANGTRPIVLAPLAAARRWAALWRSVGALW
jgi:hypothetical protein